MCGLIKGVRIIVPKLPQVIVVKKKSILNNQPAAGAEIFLLDCPNATFGQCSQNLIYATFGAVRGIH